VSVLDFADSFGYLQQNLVRFDLAYFTIRQRKHKSFYGFNRGIIFPPGEDRKGHKGQEANGDGRAKG